MGVQPNNIKTAVSSTLFLSLLALAGCNKPATAPQQAAAPAADQPAQPAPAPYTPPTAEQLSQMVAPIALFPDKLVGQVLAGATYPEQITAANEWLARNPSLRGDALQAAETSQPWDVSVKALTTFPSVLNQMASNIQWTTSLGEAYVNDPTDVMNAIQALRVRAQQAGTLKTSHHLRVSAIPHSSPPPTYVTQSPSEPPVYAGPAVIPPPPETIVIEPADPDVVYVPHYDPAVVYGEPVRVYPGWTRPQPSYSTENLVTTGLLSFGAGVLVGSAVSHHHDWGWNSWGVNWGGPRRGHDDSWRPPAVVHDNAPYVSKSVTVVNRVSNVTNITNNNVTTNNNNYRTTNNVDNRTQVAANSVPQRQGEPANAAHPAPHPAPGGTVMGGPPPAQRPAGPMTMPHFTARDRVPGARPSPVAPAAPAPHPVAPPPAQALAAAPHIAPAPPAIPHDLHQHPQGAPAMPTAKVAPPAPTTVRPVHEETRGDRVPAQAMLDRAHANALRQGDVVRERAAPAPAPTPAPAIAHERGSINAHVPPVQHADAGPPHPAPPAPHREGGSPGQPPAHATPPQMLAMHNEHAHAAPPAPPAAKQHAEKHEEHKHPHDKQDGQ